VSETPHSAAEKAQEKPAPQGAPAEQRTGEGDRADPARRPASLLDMLFREAEVIARNLKESGTRR
jgi:hypothetical protein